jgi:hypothetical protein
MAKKCAVCKKEKLLFLPVCEECFKGTDNHTMQERVSVLVQALRLANRHLDGASGLTDIELKNYIQIILKTY